jgi:hypothetical protein
MTTFDPLDSATWAPTLTLQQVALIYQRTPNAIRHALTPKAKRLFAPAPFQKHPMRWRKADVLRDVEGARGMSLRRAS